MKKLQSIWYKADIKPCRWALLILIIVYPVAFIWQCGDLTDSGFFALSYQNFFSELTEGRTASISFLADLIGAVWNKIFPELGILGFKFLYLIFLYLILLSAYFIFKDQFNNKALLLIAIFCGLVFAVRSTPFIFSRDIASWFFLIFFAYSFLEGLKKKGTLFYLFSGFCIGLAILSRFPNIVLLFILPLILFYHFWNFNKRSLLVAVSKSVKTFVLVAAGLLIGWIAFFLILRIFNIHEVFFSNLQSVRAEDQSSYSFASLLMIYIRDLAFFIPHLVSIAALIFFTAVVINISQWRKNSLILYSWLLLLLFAAFIVYASFNYEYNLKFFAPAVCALPVIYSLIKKDEFSLMSALFIALALTQLAGTNTGLFLKMMFGMTLIIPLSFLILTKKYRLNLIAFSFDMRPVFSLAFAVLVFLSLYARMGWIYHVGEGITIRLQAIYPVQHSLMKGLYSTKKRSDHIMEITGAIDSNLRINNSLFIYGHQPMIYFLTKQKPPIEKYWLTNDYVQAEDVFRSLESGISTGKNWPLIVDTKQRVFEGKAGSYLMEFLDRYNYKIVADRPGFTIWNVTSP